MNTLQVKIFGAFLLVILMAVGSNALYVKQGTEQEIEVYEERTERLYMLRMEHWLLGYYAHGGGWDDISVYIEEMEVLSGQRVILTNAYGEVIADSQGELLGQYFEKEHWHHRSLIHHRGEGLLGMLYISPEPTIETELTRELAESISTSLYVGSLIAVGFALLLTMVLSSAIASPMRKFSEAAKRVGAGDFTYQVHIKDRGDFGQLAAAFNRMTRDLRSTSLMRRHLTADIAHELRTPLTNIRGYVEAMKDSLVPYPEGVDLVEDESVQLSRLVDDLQELALAEAGALKLSLEPVTLQQVVRHVIRGQESTALKSGITLIEAVPDHPVVITADEGRLRQMLQNLIANAVIHTAAGGTITVSLDWNDRSARITVTDTGRGMSAEELSHVFDRFYRADPSRSRSTGGTGLGLTITRYLAEALGGTVEAESTPGKGSVFTIRLPLTREGLSI